MCKKLEVQQIADLKVQGKLSLQKNLDGNTQNCVTD